MRRMVLLAVLLVAGCGGSDSLDYGTVLETDIPPLAAALDDAEEPCLAEKLDECAELMRNASASLVVLMAGLQGPDVPEEVAADDAQLRAALSSLQEVLARFAAAAEAGEDYEVAEIRSELDDASARVNDALGQIAEQLDIDLPSI